MSRAWLIAPLRVVGLSLFAGCWQFSVFAEEAPSRGEILFARRVATLLAEKCTSCHGNDPKEIAGGLDLRSSESARRGGDSGEQAWLAHQADRSPLYLAARRQDGNWSPMPPKEAEALTAEQLDWLREWIDEGGVWLSEARVAEIQAQYRSAWSVEDGITVATSGGLADTWTQRRYKPEGLWAYRPLNVPSTVEAKSMPEAIDSLIAERVPPGLPLAPPATRQALIRRASYDLLGLPPTKEEIDAFVADTRDDRLAFADVVDRLLASPHYGERMARHWLDVVRYADSSGFANDYERGNAWRYRDYVVRAFNDDKPYNEFIREQIAGDEINPTDPEKIIATGFLRMGPWELTGMEVAKIARQRFLDDVTNSVGETFLAHTLQCARCHDHKFDPIPTHDYYAVQAVFATTQLADREAAFLDRENCNGFEEEKYLRKKLADHEATLEELDALLLQNAERWYQENKKPIDRWNEAVAQATQAEGRRGVFNSARQILLNSGLDEAEFPPKLVGFTAREFGMERVARKGVERLQWELERYQPYALAVYNGPQVDKASVTAPMRMAKQTPNKGPWESTAILAGGDPFSPTKPVKPGVLSVLVAFSPEPSISSVLAPEIDEQPKGRRLGFADWIATPHNPLTSRTLVNRLWLWHFGEPIAGNPNNFGSTGKLPTHPELLDYLANQLLEKGWSIKALHRGIMQSEAYRRSSEHPDPDVLNEKDPLHQAYAVFRPRRLSSDELRDAMIKVTGEWNPVLGGIPNRPEMNLEAALQPRQVMGTFAAAWVPNPLPSQRHRRTLYALKLRGLVDPFQDVFNAPASDFSCERRETSTVTPQVFSLLNSQSIHDRALALANQAVKLAADGDDSRVIMTLYHLAYGRSPTPEELQLCSDFWQQAERRIEPMEPVSRTMPREVERNAVEENTGERFSFRERLHAYEDFVPDLQPKDVPLRTRALADIALVLLNSNEFVYVY